MAIKPAQGRVTILDKATQPLRSIANAFKNLGASSKKTNTNEFIFIDCNIMAEKQKSPNQKT